jgi:hypothetical protein
MHLLAQATQPRLPFYRTITLTLGQATILDTEEYEEAAKITWHAIWIPNMESYYASARIDGKTCYLHRFIMKPGPGFEVDHIRTADTLDNRRDNLRVVTHSQNQMNRRRQANNTSGYKGVSLFRRTGRYRAYIMVRGQETHLGYHDTAEEAYAAYCKAAIELHGEFARLA